MKLKMKVKSELQYGMPYSTFLPFCIIVSVCHLERSPIFKACLETLIALHLDVRMHEQTYADFILYVSAQWAFSAISDPHLTAYWSGPHNSQQSSPLISLSSILCTTGCGPLFWIMDTIQENEGIMQINPTYDNAIWRMAPSHFLRLSVFPDREHFKSQNNESSIIIHSLSPTFLKAHLAALHQCSLHLHIFQLNISTLCNCCGNKSLHMTPMNKWKRCRR